ncbi:hypothetical protein [Bacillus sp. ISL-18]|nr:hypothetical protein [Bacillus sp. ISL-18]
MELLIEQCDHNQAEEPCEKCTPNIDREESIEISDYDYHKRLWF